jgi:CBS domain-containing protein
MQISELSSRSVVAVAPNDSLVTAAQLMRTRHVGFLVVTQIGVSDGEPLGVLTDRDIVVAVVSKGVDPSQLNVKDSMSAKPLVLKADTRPDEALRQMRAYGVRRVPVVDNRGRMTGILALDDLLGWLAGTLADAAGIVRREQRVERQVRA